MRPDATALLLEMRGGATSGIDHLFPLVYDELREIAHRQLRRERSGHTLSTTALVHEAYERLVDQTRVEWQDHTHFCAVASRAMRRILVDHARRRKALKRGGNQQPVPLDESLVAMEEQADLLVALDEALDRLTKLNERLSKVVEMRFFGGMTEEEIAHALDIAPRTVRRDWVKAKAWLYSELYPEET